MSTEGLGAGRGLLTGEVFAGFRVEEVLGRGGMGWVYRVHDLALDRERALKVLDPSLARDEAFRGRFQRESKMAAAIEHPAVVPVYQAGEQDERLFIVMRLVRGPDLQKLVVTEGPLDARRTARIVAAVAGGLDAAHARGIVHRDVKPANILLELGSEGERVYLSDFGIGRPSEAGSALTSTGDVIGTADYIAPEQIRGQRADARSDVYTLGCVVCFLLTGEPPFARENQLATLFAHANAERPRPSLLEPGLPEAIDDVVARATAVEPDERFESAGELAAELTEAVGPSRTSMQTAPPPTAPMAPAAGAASAAAAAEAPPIPPRPPEPATTRLASDGAPGGGRRRLPFVLAGLALLVAAGVAAALVLGGGDEEDPTTTATTTDGSGQDQIPLFEDVRTDEVTGGEPANALVVSRNNILVASQAESTVYRVEPSTFEPARDEPYQVPTPTSVSIGFESVWVTSSGEGALFRFRAGSDLPEPIPVGTSPVDAVVGAQVWTANLGDSTVSRVDPEAQVEDATVRLDWPPTAITAGLGSIWVLGSQESTLARLDPVAADVVRDVDFPGTDLADIAIADGAVWVVDKRSGDLARLSGDLDLPRRATDVEGTPVALAAGLGSLWAAVKAPNLVVEVDPETREVVAEARFDPEHVPAAVSVAPPDAPSAGTVWVSHLDGAVSRIRP